ncbi:uncharacterized protein G2W53_009685 [Senna tora]|uniref:Uncharacterized protein n=1 Tax=Senna tora TaxID=362788 RepID=A0A835CAF6_9FABA|nr:uncharacterized protein G2W53_009685 [Senna tora]
MAICHRESHRIHDFYEVREVITKKLESRPTYEPDKCLKGIPKYFKENFDPP